LGAHFSRETEKGEGRRGGRKGLAKSVWENAKRKSEFCLIIKKLMGENSKALATCKDTTNHHAFNNRQVKKKRLHVAEAGVGGGEKSHPPARILIKERGGGKNWLQLGQKKNKVGSTLSGEKRGNFLGLRGGSRKKKTGKK